MGVSLSGDYQITNTGVVIDARVNDSCIREFKQFLQEYYSRELLLSCGYVKGGEMKSYKVPNFDFRRLLLNTKLVDIQSELLLNKVRLNNYFLHDSLTFYSHLGIQCSSSYTHFAVNYARIPMARGRYGRKLVSNSAWIWNVGSDGRVRMTLNGLVNKHMITIVLSNALKLAKDLDFLGQSMLKNEKVARKELTKQNIWSLDTNPCLST